MNPTSITKLNAYANGQIVELPPFAEGQPFFARIRRPSMLALAKSGKIPNSLLETANELFTGSVGSKSNKKDPVTLKEIFGILDIICEACFLEPTYKEIKEAGMELTDDQLMFVFNYSQTGVKALENFRKQQGSTGSSGDVSEVSENAS